MKTLFFLIFLLTNFNAIAQLRSSETGLQILDIESYILEGGNVSIEVIPYRPQYDVGIGQYVPPNTQNDWQIQNDLSQTQYKSPTFSQSDQNIFLTSLARLFNNTQRSPEQQATIQNRLNVANNYDQMVAGISQMLNNLSEYSRSVYDFLADTSRVSDQNNEIIENIHDIRNSSFRDTKKRALLSLAKVKLDRNHYEGEFGHKMNIVRQKYWAIDEDSFESEKAYEFLDMGATSYSHASSEYIDGNTENAESSLELSNTFLDIALGSTPFVGMFKDAYEAYSGLNLITDAPLSDNERMLCVVGLGVGILSGGTLGSVVKNLPKLLPYAKRVINNGIDIIQAARKYGISSPKGAKVYAKIHDSIQDLQGGLKVKRIREGGDINKVAVVGRKMPGIVDPTAEHLRNKNFVIETFSDDVAWKQMKKHQLSYNRANNLPDGAWLPNSEVIKSNMYKNNKIWAQKLRDEGYTVLDMGNPNNLVEMSAFYSIEKKILFGN